MSLHPQHNASRSPSVDITETRLSVMPTPFSSISGRTTGTSRPIPIRKSIVHNNHPPSSRHSTTSRSPSQSKRSRHGHASRRSVGSTENPNPKEEGIKRASSFDCLERLDPGTTDVVDPLYRSSKLEQVVPMFNDGRTTGLRSLTFSPSLMSSPPPMSSRTSRISTLPLNHESLIDFSQHRHHRHRLIHRTTTESPSSTTKIPPISHRNKSEQENSHTLPSFSSLMRWLESPDPRGDPTLAALPTNPSIGPTRRREGMDVIGINKVPRRYSVPFEPTNAITPPPRRAIGAFTESPTSGLDLLNDIVVGGNISKSNQSQSKMQPPIISKPLTDAWRPLPTSTHSTFAWHPENPTVRQKPCRRRVAISKNVITRPRASKVKSLPSDQTRTIESGWLAMVQAASQKKGQKVQDSEKVVRRNTTSQVEMRIRDGESAAQPLVIPRTITQPPISNNPTFSTGPRTPLNKLPGFIKISKQNRHSLTDNLKAEKKAEAAALWISKLGCLRIPNLPVITKQNIAKPKKYITAPTKQKIKNTSASTSYVGNSRAGPFKHPAILAKRIKSPVPGTIQVRQRLERVANEWLNEKETEAEVDQIVSTESDSAVSFVDTIESIVHIRADAEDVSSPPPLRKRKVMDDPEPNSQSSKKGMRGCSEQRSAGCSGISTL